MPPTAAHRDLPPIWAIAKQHPIYRYRAAILITVLIGIVFCCLALDDYGRGFPAAIPFLILSGLIALGDLLGWASKKLANPDDEPEWPMRFYLIWDVVMCLIMLYIFGFAVNEASYSFHGPGQVFASWAAFAYLCGSLFHGLSFWKELMARFRNKWRAAMTREPCPRCGFQDNERLQPEPQTVNSTLIHDLFSTGHATEDHQTRGVLTPQATGNESAEECLIGSTSGSGYGSIDHPERSLDQVERVVVSKGKKKSSTREKKESSN